MKFSLRRVHVLKHCVSCRGYTHFKPQSRLQLNSRGGYVLVGAVGLGGIVYLNSRQEVP